MRFHDLDALLGVNGSHLDHCKALKFNQYVCSAKKRREEEGKSSCKPQRSPCFITDNKEAKNYPFPKSQLSCLPQASKRCQEPLPPKTPCCRAPVGPWWLRRQTPAFPKAAAGLYPPRTQCSLFTPKMKIRWQWPWSGRTSHHGRVPAGGPQAMQGKSDLKQHQWLKRHLLQPQDQEKHKSGFWPLLPRLLGFGTKHSLASLKSQAYKNTTSADTCTTLHNV